MSPHHLSQITAHTHWFSPDERTDRPILGAVVGEKATAWIDSGNSVAHANLFLQALTAQQIAPPSYLLLTHWHWDHVFGNAGVEGTIIAQRETQEMLHQMQQWAWDDAALAERVAAGIEIEFCQTMIQAEMSEAERQDLEIKAADIAFGQELELDLGGVRCQLCHIGGDHASDSVLIYVPEDRVLFLGDCLYPNLYAPPAHYTVGKLFPLIDHILAYEADHFVLSHHQAPLPRPEMEEYTTLLKAIGQTVAGSGHNPAAILRSLSTRLGHDPSADDMELVEIFLAGLDRD